MSNRNIPPNNGQAAALAAPQDTSASYITGGKLAIIMVSVLLGVLLSALDQTIVGPALPRIIGDLKGFDHYSWVVTIYLLTSTISVPIFGKLSDMYGRKWFYVAGIVVFLIGSGLSGLSGDVLPFFGLGSATSGIFELIAFRGIQGLGAGILMANAFAIIADLIPPAERGKWQGAFGGVFGLASVIGPTIGGYLTDNLTWRWVFYVNIPVGIIALAVLITTFPNATAHTAKKVIDWVGAAALVLSLTPLLLALSLGGTTGWEWNSTKVVSLFIMAAVFLGIFLFVETRAAEPILPLDMFRNRIFTTSMIAVFFTGVGLFGAVLYIPLFIQAVQGDSATTSGNTITPLTLSLVVSSIIAGQIISRTGKYKALAIGGMALVTVGMLLLWTMQIDTPRVQMITYMVLMGLGMGVSFPLFTLVVQNAFPIQRVGVATAAVQFFRSMGSTVGVAVLGSIVNNRTQVQFGPNFISGLNAYKTTLPAQAQAAIKPEQFLAGLGNLNPQVLVSTEGLTQLQTQLASHGVPASVVPTFVNLIKDAMKPALFSGIQEAFLIGSVLLGVGFVATLFLKEIPLRKSNRRAPGGGMAEGAGESFTPTEAGREIAAEGVPATQIPVRDEPKLVRG